MCKIGNRRTAVVRVIWFESGRPTGESSSASHLVPTVTLGKHSGVHSIYTRTSTNCNELAEWLSIEEDNQLKFSEWLQESNDESLSDAPLNLIFIQFSIKALTLLPVLASSPRFWLVQADSGWFRLIQRKLITSYLSLSLSLTNRLQSIVNDY